MDGEPDAPERWLVRVAHNRAVDALRRERAAEPLARAGTMPESASAPTPASDDEIRLMFLCCDRALQRAAQIALVLNVAFGLTARQIATAFVSEERTVAQRIVRAKQRLRELGVRFDMPTSDALPDRLAVILDALYLVFSEGYYPTESVEPLDVGLCNEALRFVRLLTESASTALPTAFALQALMCFHSARLPARLADDGSLLLLAEQDRARWDAAATSEAFRCLERAAAGTVLSRYHVEAAIAASTPWRRRTTPPTGSASRRSTTRSASAPRRSWST